MTEPQRSLLPVLVTEQLERAANRALRYAPLTRLQLRPLQGRTLALELQRPPLRLLIQVERRTLGFRSHWEEPADVTIRGPALGLLRQLPAREVGIGELMQAGIEIEGDQQLASQYMKILQELDLDLETALGDLIGDVAAHQFSGVARAGWDWFRTTTRTLVRQSRHWLGEEVEWVLTPRRLDTFEGEVNRLRQDTDRLQARLQRLQRRLQPPAEQTESES